MKKVIHHKNGRVEVLTVNDEPSLTQQHFLEETDINNIVSKYTKTGQWPQNTKRGFSVDLSSVEDYHTSLNKVLAAQNAFQALPAKIRARFQNDPAQLLDFMSNNNNHQEAISLGLIPPPTHQSYSNPQTQNNQQSQTQNLTNTSPQQPPTNPQS